MKRGDWGDVLAPGPCGSQGRAGPWARVANSGHCRLHAGSTMAQSEVLGHVPPPSPGPRGLPSLQAPPCPSRGPARRGALRGPFCELMMKGGPGSPRTGIGALSWADMA